MPARIYNIFPHYLINGTIFEKKKIIGHTMCASIVSTDLSETFFILGTDGNMIKNIFRSSRKVPFILVRFK
jgi:hypothetical protein